MLLRSERQGSGNVASDRAVAAALHQPDAAPRKAQELHTPSAFGKRVMDMRRQRDELVGERDQSVDVEAAGNIGVALVTCPR